MKVNQMQYIILQFSRLSDIALYTLNSLVIAIEKVPNVTHDILLHSVQ